MRLGRELGAAKGKEHPGAGAHCGQHPKLPIHHCEPSKIITMYLHLVRARLCHQCYCRVAATACASDSTDTDRIQCIQLDGGGAASLHFSRALLIHTQRDGSVRHAEAARVAAGGSLSLHLGHLSHPDRMTLKQTDGRSIGKSKKNRVAGFADEEKDGGWGDGTTVGSK